MFYGVVGDTCNTHVQGKTPMRVIATEDMDDTRNARPSQTSFSSSMHNLIWVGLNICQGYCNVRMGCMCIVTGAAKIGRCGWEDNGIQGVRDKRTGIAKVNHNTMSMSMAIHGGEKWNGSK